MENKEFHFKSSGKFLKDIIKNYKGKLIVAVIFMILFSITSPLQIWVLKPMIDKLFDKKVEMKIEVPKRYIDKFDTHYKNQNIIKFSDSTEKKIKNVLTKKYLFDKKNILVFISVYLLIITFFRGLFRFLHSYLLAYIVNSVVKYIRKILYNKILNLPFKYYTSSKSGDLVSRFTNDITILQNVLSSIVIQVIQKPAEIIFLLFFVFFISWKLTLIACIIIPFVAVVIKMFGKSIRKWVYRSQFKISDITSHIQESIYGMKIIKSFTAEHKMENDFEKENESYLRHSLKTMKYQLLASPVVEFITIAGVIGVLWSSLYLVTDDNLSSGTIVTFIAACMTMYKPVKELTRVNINYQQIKVVIERIFEILKIENNIQEVSTPREFQKLKKIITFNNVGFRYDETGPEVLKNISFSINEGKTVAIVGPSGIGKSTLVNLLPRFYDVSSGILSFDRVNIKNFTLQSLRKNISIVEQEIFLFNDTVANNICFPEVEPDMEKVKKCSELANASEFIEVLPEQYETVLGERGQKLSVGQKQRIAIARAIYKDASILILDEATSALDTESEQLVQDALDKLVQSYTTFVIAHRLSTVVNADLILVLKDNTVAEMGTHQQLLKKNKSICTIL